MSSPSLFAPGASLPEFTGLIAFGTIQGGDNYEAMKELVQRVAEKTRVGTDELIYYRWASNDKDKTISFWDAYRTLGGMMQHMQDVGSLLGEAYTMMKPEDMEVFITAADDEIDQLEDMGENFFPGTKKTFFRPIPTTSFFNANRSAFL